MSCSPGRRSSRGSSPSISARSSAIDAGGGATDRDELFSSARWFIEAAAREQTDDPRVRGRPLGRPEPARPDRDARDPVSRAAAPADDARSTRASRRPRADWGARLASYTSLTLGPLGAEHARELALRRLVDASRLDEVVEVAEGNPLFIEQLAATMEETATGALPTSIRGLVAARLDALPQQDRALLLDAAVVGRVFWSDVLAGAEQRSGHRADTRRARAPRPDPSRHVVDPRGSAAVRVHALTDPGRRLRAAAPRRPRASSPHGRGVLRTVDRRVGRGDRRARPALARRGRLRPGDRPADARRRAGRARAGRRTTPRCSIARRSSSCRPDDTARRTQLTRRLALASAASFHLDDVRRPESPPA